MSNFGDFWFWKQLRGKRGFRRREIDGEDMKRIFRVEIEGKKKTQKRMK